MIILDVRKVESFNVEDKMSKEHILVVEDDVDINNLIAKTLTKQDYKVTQAFSGSEANLRLGT